MNRDTSKRRYELDWLRVSAIMVVFLYHSTRFLDLGNWHIKNTDTYVWVELWNIFVTRWMMPLFFIISGASLFYAMRKSSGFKKFYMDKFLRLMIPVLFASVTHSAVQVYLDRLTHGRFSGSFFQFIHEYFNGLYSGIGLSGSGNFAFHGMHLWYLLFLFVYGLICFQLFTWFRSGGQKALELMTDFLAIPGLIYIGFTAPLVIMKALIPHAILDTGNGGWGFLYYLWFLIAGFIIYSNDRLQRSITKQRWISLLLGGVLSVIYLYLLFGVSEPFFQGKSGDWVSSLLSFFSAWTLVFAILGFSMLHLSFNRPLLYHVNEVVLPFFILHQTVLLGTGYFVMNWQIPDLMKWVINFTGSFIVITAICILLVRKFDLLRFLFGMKTSHPFFGFFRKKGALIILPLLWLGVIVLAGFNHKDPKVQKQYPMPLEYHSGQDILINAESVNNRLSAGVRVVNDEKASIGKAIEFSSGANNRVEPRPEVYFETRFSAPAGRYFVWLRGKSDVDSEMTDSIWLQVDNQIGTQQGSVHLGNWNSFYPVGVYAGHVNLVPPCTSGMVKTPTNLFNFQNSSPEAVVAALKTPTENLGSIILFTPDTANNWREVYGFKTMEQLQEYLWENVTRSKSELVEHYRFFALSLEAEQNERGSKQLNPDHLDLPDDAQIPFIFRGPKSIKIVVAGGMGDAWGWGTYFHRDPVSTSIDKWR